MITSFNGSYFWGFIHYKNVILLVLVDSKPILNWRDTNFY